MSDGYIYRNGRLKWEKLSADSYTARRDGVRYRVERVSGMWRALCDGSLFAICPTIREAVRLCQQDYACHVDWCTADES